MEFSVDVEKKSSILRKLTVKVLAKEVKRHLDRGLIEVQKTANLKGFRPGKAPIWIIKENYGQDVRRRVLEKLINQSYEQAVKDQGLATVGNPKIDTLQSKGEVSDHSTHKHDHDHDHAGHDHSHDHSHGDSELPELKEDQDFTYTATVEVMPELQVKHYTGISVNQDKVDVTEDKVQKVINNLLNSQAQLTPVTEPRAIQTGDFVDTEFAGGIVTETGVELRGDMKGTKIIEIGSDTFIPGFEDELLGMKPEETKTFRITFPKDYHPELAEKVAEFTVTTLDIKEKKLPELDEEFAKQLGYEGIADLKVKARDFLEKDLKAESDRKVKSDILAVIIEKNPFDVPPTLIEGQTRALAEDWAQELKKQNFNDQMIQDMIGAEFAQLKGRAESQVRASLILEAIAKEENLVVSADEMKQEIVRIAASSQVEEEKLRAFYDKNPGRKLDLEFRLRQERTLTFLLDKSKIKWVSA